MILQGIRTRIAKKPYIFVIFQWGPDPPRPLSGSAHVLRTTALSKKFVFSNTAIRQGLPFNQDIFIDKSFKSGKMIIKMWIL